MREEGYTSVARTILRIQDRQCRIMSEGVAAVMLLLNVVVPVDESEGLASNDEMVELLLEGVVGEVDTAGSSYSTPELYTSMI